MRASATPPRWPSPSATASPARITSKAARPSWKSASRISPASDAPHWRTGGEMLRRAEISGAKRKGQAMYTDLNLHIDGEWLNGSGRKGEDVINPATGKALAHLPHASKADLDRALEAAEKSLKAWSATSPYDRSKVLRKAADLMRERAEQIARVITQEQGKIFAEAKAETLTTADIIDWMAEEGRRAYGRIIPGRTPNSRLMVIQEPVGVVAAFTPWNFPILTPVRKFVAALAAGCSVVIKASEETPGGCLEAVRCFHDAGLPKGVLNLVFGVPAEVSEHLIGAEAVRKISFTGSVPVGKLLAGLAAKGMKRATMELGGHSPVVVFGDADPEK